MRGFDRDLIRGEHYGQRSCEPHKTHGCTDQPAGVKKVLANPEPSTHGTNRKCQSALTMSALGGNPDGICSQRAFPLLTDDVEKALVIFGDQ
jgi:hypothetical protein